jgi:hypothetical protein
MPHLPFHPAPGFGDLMPGMFVVPQNPIQDAGTPLVPSVQAANAGRVAYRPKIGDLLPGAFAVPQNPILHNLATGMQGMGCASCDSGDCGGGGFAAPGLQGVDLAQVGGWLQSQTIGGVPNWALVAGAVVAYMMFSPGGSDYRAARRSLDSQYRGYRRAASRIAA